MLSSSRTRVPSGGDDSVECELWPECEPGGEGEGVDPGRRRLAAVRVRCERLPPDRDADGARGEWHQDNSGEEEQVERVGHETGEELLDAVERNRRGQAGGERDDSAEGEERTRVVEGSQPAGRIWMGAPDACQQIPLGVWEGGEHAPQGAVTSVRYRGAQVGVDLA